MLKANRPRSSSGGESRRRTSSSPVLIVIDLEASSSFSLPEEEKKKKEQEKKLVEVKAEEKKELEREYVSQGWSRGRKNRHGDDLELEEGRSNKHSAVFPEQTVRTEMFDMILLGTGEAYMRGTCNLQAAMQKEEASRSSQRNQYSKGPGAGAGKGRRKRQPKRDQVVDLRTILIHCTQAVAIDDRRNANELLKQIRPPAPSASSRPSAPPPSSSTMRAPATGRTSSHARSPAPSAGSALACRTSPTLSFLPEPIAVAASTRGLLCYRGHVSRRVLRLQPPPPENFFSFDMDCLI